MTFQQKKGEAECLAQVGLLSLTSWFDSPRETWDEVKNLEDLETLTLCVKLEGQERDQHHWLS